MLRRRGADGRGACVPTDRLPARARLSRLLPPAAHACCPPTAHAYPPSCLPACRASAQGLARAYTLYFRLAALVITGLPAHPEHGQAAFRARLAVANTEAMEAMDAAAAIKPRECPTG